jgi:hypothetical protein
VFAYVITYEHRFHRTALFEFRRNEFYGLPNWFRYAVVVELMSFHQFVGRLGVPRGGSCWPPLGRGSWGPTPPCLIERQFCRLHVYLTMKNKNEEAIFLLLCQFPNWRSGYFFLVEKVTKSAVRHLTLRLWHLPTGGEKTRIGINTPILKQFSPLFRCQAPAALMLAIQSYMDSCRITVSGDALSNASPDGILLIMLFFMECIIAKKLSRPITASRRG